MTYQFDPAPDGLRYEPIKLTFTSLQIWFLKDKAPEPWIDLRSIFEIVKAPWMGRWSQYLDTKKLAWELEECIDRKMRETLLAPANRIQEILGELEQQLSSNGLLTAADQLNVLRSQLRYRLDDAIRGQEIPTIKLARKPSQPSAKPQSKITPYIVNQIHSLSKKGYTRVAIGKAVRLSPGTISLIISGKYSSFDPLAKQAWQETFGAQNPPQVG